MILFMFCLGFFCILAALTPSSVSKQLLYMAVQWQIVNTQPLPLLLTQQGTVSSTVMCPFNSLQQKKDSFKESGNLPSFLSQMDFMINGKCMRETSLLQPAAVFVPLRQLGDNFLIPCLINKSITASIGFKINDKFFSAWVSKVVVVKKFP